MNLIKHYGVHAFGLLLSLSAIAHIMTGLSNDPVFKVFFAAGGVFAGLSIQYLRGLSAAYRKARNKAKANWLWVAVIACIGIFEFSSSFNIVLNQLSKEDGAYLANIAEQNKLSADIKDLDQTIQRKQAQQDLEFKTNPTIGKSYRQFDTEIVTAQNAKTAKGTELKRLKEEAAKLPKSSFVTLSESSGIPVFWLTLILCLGLMFLINFVPLLTPWKVSLPGVEEVVTVSVTGGVTPVATANSGPEMVECACGCGRKFVKTKSRKFYSDACRVREHRKKLIENPA